MVKISVLLNIDCMGNCWKCVDKHYKHVHKMYYSNLAIKAHSFAFYTVLLLFFTECSKALDVAFMVDSSGSIHESDYNKALEFVENIIYSLDIRSDGSGTRVAALSFSGSTDLQFDLNDHYEKSRIVRRIHRLEYFGGGTRVDLGLQKLSTTVFQTRNGARSIQEGKVVLFSRNHINVDLTGIPRVAFVMTDGKASRGFSTDAQNLKDLKVNVYAIGIGDGISISELVEIASYPPDHYVYTVEDFDHIQDILSESVAKICNSKELH